jgi:hypothetical protein
MQLTNEIRNACKILDVQILSDVVEDEELVLPIETRSPSDEHTFQGFEDFEKYLAERLVPNVEFWDEDRPLEDFEEALDLIRALNAEIFENLGVGYPSLHMSPGGSSEKRWEWAISNSLLNDDLITDLEEDGSAFESCDDDNILLTLETDCMNDFDDMKEYYQKVITAKQRVCKKCGHYIIAEIYEIAEDDGTASIVCEDCYREQQDLGENGVPAGLK